jgi:adenylate cyclase
MQSIETAMRLNPRYPFWYLVGRGHIYFMQRNYQSAIADLEAADERNSKLAFTKWRLAAAYAQAGRIDDAEWQIEEMQIDGFNREADDIIRTMGLQHQVDINHYREGLIKAGLPEG